MDEAAGADEEEEEESIDPSGLFDTAVSGAATDAQATQDDLDGTATRNATDAANAAKLLFKVGETVSDGTAYGVAGTAEDGSATGAILTATEVSLVPVGKKVEIIVNPAQGYALREGTLSYAYETQSTGTQQGEAVQSANSITRDANGRYWLTVTEAMKGKPVTITCEFEQVAGDGNAAAANGSGTTASGMQATGALAVGVVKNTSSALVDVGDAGFINAGGALRVESNGFAAVETVADGSGVSEEDAPPTLDEGGEPAEEPEAPAQTAIEKYAVKVAQLPASPLVTGMKYTYSASTGTVTFYPVFADTATELDKRNTAMTATVTYTRADGVQATAQLVRSQNDGSFRLVLEGADGLYPEELSTVTVAFGIVTAAGQGIASAIPTPSEAKEIACTTADGWAIGHAIVVASTGEGTVTRVSNAGNTDTYAIKVEADTENGYKFAAGSALTATYTDAAGVTQTAALQYDANTGNYILKDAALSAIPEGALITIDVVFAEDTRKVFAEVKPVETQDLTNGAGSVTVDKTDVRITDTVTVTVTPEAGSTLQTLRYTYKDESGSVHTVDVSASELGPDGTFTLEMPRTAEGSAAADLTFAAYFIRKPLHVVVPPSFRAL